MTETRRARLALTCLAGLLVFGLWHVSFGTPLPKSPAKEGDVSLFREVVTRMRAGETYYDAMNGVLRRRSYPTASIVNWRLPATFVLVAGAPGVVHATMLGLACLALGLTLYAFRHAPVPARLLALVMAAGGAVLPAIPPDGLYMPETWAGLGLMLSVLAYALGAWRAAVVCAIAAACARELAVPYAVASLAMALRGGRRGEVRWYAVGLSVFIAYYLAHAAWAWEFMQASDRVQPTWIKFNGWPFVIRTVGMGGWSLLLPLWAAAVGAVLVVASLWSRAGRHLKALVVLYVAGFFVVGHSFNDYWGLMTGPAWSLAMTHGLIVAPTLLRAAFPPASQPA